MKRFKMFSGLGISLFLSSVILALVPSVAQTAVPQLINFQGILKDGSGNPVANGTYFVNFRIYSVPAGGTVMWGDTQTVVTSSGLFNAVLGRGMPVPDTVFNDSVRYLGIQVFPDPEMTPRQRLTTSSYSFRSEDWTSTRQNLFRLNGNVGIGTTGPNTKLTVWTPSAAGVQEGIRINNPFGFVGSGHGSSLVFSQDRDTSENYIDATIEGAQESPNTSANGYLSFSTKSAAVVGEKMRITSIGNVGIGTTAPTAKLDVRGDVRLGSSGQYLAPAGQENLRIIRGVVNSAGGISAGSGFTVSHTALSGIYVINFNTPFAGPPSVVATADNTGFTYVLSATTDGVVSSSATIKLVAQAGGSSNNFLIDQPFHFIAIGPR